MKLGLKSAMDGSAASICGRVRRPLATDFGVPLGQRVEMAWPKVRLKPDGPSLELRFPRHARSKPTPTSTPSDRRAANRRRPLRRQIAAPPTGADLDAIASRVRYVGSAEHKSYPSFAGPPRPRVADATKCDPRFDEPGPLTQWLAEAIRSGQVGGPWEGEFPRHAWFVVDDICYEGRLVNRGRGEYKGYALRPQERPEGL